MKLKQLTPLLLILGSWMFSFSADSQGAISPQAEQLMQVRVIDGDTIHARNKAGEYLKIRMIGINAPESRNWGNKRKEPCGKKATSMLKSLIDTADKVYIIADPTKPDRGRYGRLLRYVVVLIKGKKYDAGAGMLNAGWAKEASYGETYILQKVYKSTQVQAKAAKLGVWNKKCKKTF